LRLELGRESLRSFEEVFSPIARMSISDQFAFQHEVSSPIMNVARAREREIDNTEVVVVSFIVQFAVEASGVGLDVQVEERGRLGVMVGVLQHEPLRVDVVLVVLERSICI